MVAEQVDPSPLLQTFLEPARSRLHILGRVAEVIKVIAKEEGQIGGDLLDQVLDCLVLVVKVRDDEDHARFPFRPHRFL